MFDGLPVVCLAGRHRKRRIERIMYSFEVQSAQSPKTAEEDASMSHQYTWRTRSWVRPLRWVEGKLVKMPAEEARSRPSLPSEPETSQSDPKMEPCPLCAIRGVTLSQWEEWADMMGNWLGVAPAEQGEGQKPVKARSTKYEYGRLRRLQWSRQWGQTSPY